MTTTGVARVFPNDKSSHEGSAWPLANQRFGHIVSVSGSQAVAALNVSQQVLEGLDAKRIEIGVLVKVSTPGSTVIGIVSATSTSPFSYR